jgi:CTP-dependent riboflavin kinase
MVILYGPVKRGCGQWAERVSREHFQAAFFKATGEHPAKGKGTLNVKVTRCIRIKEHFRILGKEVGEDEDFLFEICRINDIWAYRVRPCHPVTGSGGHGDDILEIICSNEIPIRPEMKITLLRDDIAL